MALGETTFTKPTENKMKIIENSTHNTYLAAMFGAERYNSMWAVERGINRDTSAITNMYFLAKHSQCTWDDQNIWGKLSGLGHVSSHILKQNRQTMFCNRSENHCFNLHWLMFLIT